MNTETEAQGNVPDWLPTAAKPIMADRRTYIAIFGNLPPDDKSAILRGYYDGTTAMQIIADARFKAREEERADMETRFWSIVDPNGVPSDMWDALDRMAKAYRKGGSHD